MKVIKWKHTGLDSSGKGEFGAVNTNGRIDYSQPKGGCSSPPCNCSPGHWMTISTGLKDGVVEGITIIFDDKKEKKRFLKNQVVNANRIFPQEDGTVIALKENIGRQKVVKERRTFDG